MSASPTCVIEFVDGRTTRMPASPTCVAASSSHNTPTEVAQGASRRQSGGCTLKPTASSYFRSRPRKLPRGDAVR